MRADLEAAGAPKSFWIYAANQAVDTINRTTSPPRSATSSYEIVTGDKPRVMNIVTWGCRAFAVKQLQERRKSSLDAAAHTGVMLGRNPDQPGAFLLWLPEHMKIISASDVYVQESYMPWRRPGDRFVTDPVPLPAHADAQQPTTLSAQPAATETETRPLGTIAQEFKRVVSAKHPLGAQHGTARLSRTVLVLFSGDYNRDDGLIAFLRRLGLRVIALDNDAANGGNAAHNLLRDEVFEHLLHLASRGEFLGISAAPPCSTFSIARFAPHEEGHDGGPPPIRTRLHIRGIPNCPPKFRRKLKEANLLVDRTCAILAAATEAGSEWALENPCDRGLLVAHGGRRDLFADPRHGSIWQMPAIIELSRLASCHMVTFPMCHFSADWQKYTSLLFTPGLQRFLELDGIRCTHQSHNKRAGGAIENGRWNSTAAAAYPREFNIYLAQALYHLSDDSNRNDHHTHSPKLTQVSEPANPSGTTTVAPLPAAASAQAAGHRVHGAPHDGTPRSDAPSPTGSRDIRAPALDLLGWRRHKWG